MGNSYRRNSEGYSDPTAYAALSKIDMEERHRKLLKKTLYQVCEVAGYKLKGQIVIVDVKNGHIYRL